MISNGFSCASAAFILIEFADLLLRNDLSSVGFFGSSTVSAASFVDDLPVYF